MPVQLDMPPRVDMTMRSAQTAKKYMGNPFWVFAAFVKKIQGISVAFLPFLPFFGLYYGILSSAQNIGAWGYGANGIVFLVGYGVSVFAVYLLGNAFSGDKNTEVTMGDAFVPLLVLLPFPLLVLLSGVPFAPVWGILATALVFGAIYLGARAILRDWREANNYVKAIGIFFLTVWLMAGITAYVAKGLGTQGWGLGSVNVREQNQNQGAANAARARAVLCQQGETKYCDDAPTTTTSRPPVIPSGLIPAGMDEAEARKLLQQVCQQKGAFVVGWFRSTFQALPLKIPNGAEGLLDTFCSQSQAYQAQAPEPATDDSGMFQLGVYYFVTSGNLPPGWETISPAEMTTVTTNATAIRKFLCDKGPEPSGWGKLGEAEKKAAKDAAGEACKKAPPATPASINAPQPAVATRTPTPAPTAKPTSTPGTCGKDQAWSKVKRNLDGTIGGCVSTK